MLLMTAVEFAATGAASIDALWDAQQARPFFMSPADRPAWSRAFEHAPWTDPLNDETIVFELATTLLSPFGVVRALVANGPHHDAAKDRNSLITPRTAAATILPPASTVACDGSEPMRPSGKRRLRRGYAGRTQ